MRGDVLVLDNRYQPLGKVHWKRAICLFIEGEVEIIEEYADRAIRTVKDSWPMPAVIRWLKNIKKRKGFAGVRFSKEAVFARDKGRCSYCSERVSLSECTRDHVIPKSRGGKTEWENIVLACPECNTRKGNRTPEEAGMRLLKRPGKPDKGVPYYAILRHKTKIPKEWKSWIIYADWIEDFCAESRHDVCMTEDT